MNCSSRNFFTCFEDLPNEIIYEIFEYLDFYDIDQAFSKLKFRYYSLLNNSTYHIKINVSSMSKSTFASYCKDIIIPYEDRIYSINLSNLFIYDLCSSPFHSLSQFLRLEILILQNIESNYLENLLPHLSSLLNLSSLIIMTIGYFHNVNKLYHTVFRLTALKYFKVSVNEHYVNEILSITKNHYSSLEHFVVDSHYQIDDLSILLSYVPKLRRLSFKKLSESYYLQMHMQPIILNSLTHLSLQTKHIIFDKIELFIRNLSHQLQVFRFSTEFDVTYLNAKRWQELIVFHMPYLRIFDIELQAKYYDNQNEFHISINQFMSPFWWERQWYFTYEYTDYLARFYSIEPYRRKHYILHNGLCQHTYPYRNNNNLCSVNHISVQDDIEIKNNLIYFPHVTELTLFDHSNKTLHSISTILDRTIPLIQLFKISINCRQFCIGKLMELLYFSPNIHILIINSISLTKVSSTSIEQTQTFQAICNTNKITNLTIKESTTKECILLFIKLCPQLQQLTVGIHSYVLLSIISNLLLEFEKCCKHLSCIDPMTSNHIPFQTTDYENISTTDRLARSRAQHLQLRENRPKSVSDDEINAGSDWSDSDRECCPLSDFESTSNNDGTDDNEDNNRNKLSEEISQLNSPLLSRNHLHVTEIPDSIIDDSITSTRISFTNEIEKPKEQCTKNTSVNSVQLRKQFQQPLLPARRVETKQVSLRCSSTRSIITSQLSYTSRNNKKIMPTPTRIYLRRETTSTTISLNTHLTKDSTVSSSIFSFQSHDDNQNQRQIISPNFSQTSVPRAYEIKKIFVDDYDYGRLTDISPIRSSQPRSRQKWGTIVHPPFPLGYQHIAPEQITRAVERLSNPARCRDRHTRNETPSKRYLSTEETDALINRLSKVKTIQSPDQYCPIQRQSRTVKTLNNNWKVIEPLETNPMPIYEIPRDDQQDNKESIILRSSLGDSTRHTPFTDYRSSSTMSSHVREPASMYTLQSRDQPIIKGNRQMSFPIEQEQQSTTPTFFFEPTIISQPILYNIANTKRIAIIDQSTSIEQEQSIPTIYSISGQPRRLTVDMNGNRLDTPTQVINKSPILYSMINGPPVENEIQESNKPYLQPPPPPTVYSIVGSPARTSRGVQVSPLDPVQPAPILYTITGDTSTPINRPVENISPPTTTKPLRDATMYTLGNQGNVLRTQQQQQQQQQPIQPPTLYALVSQPNSLPKQPTKKSPTKPTPTTTITTEHINRNFERKPEAINEEIVAYSIANTKQEPQARESKVPKPEAILISLHDDEHRTRPRTAHQSPLFYATPEQTQRKPLTIIQTHPIQLSDYHSSHAYRAQKPYRERNYNNNPLPVVSNNRFERKPKPPLNQTRSHVERQQVNVPSKSTSLERYPVNRNARLGLWDNGYQTQTDDEEEYTRKTTKKKRNQKKTQPRAPWIPVW
ncbi:unnamed protein product [Rotaria sp. Silwood1]|nr:unnamed protein product [Rotaria sp. Silwood1]CAF3487629.1 unnamed protein product [Rotaria sp. Silwood1]